MGIHPRLEVLGLLRLDCPQPFQNSARGHIVRGVHVQVFRNHWIPDVGTSINIIVPILEGNVSFSFRKDSTSTVDTYRIDGLM